MQAGKRVFANTAEKVTNGATASMPSCSGFQVFGGGESKWGNRELAEPLFRRV